MRVRNRVLTLLGVLAGAYLALGIGVVVGQRRLIYPAPRTRIEPVMDGATLTRVQGPRGRTVHALFVPAPPGGSTVVHFHGNGEQLADLVPFAWSFQRAKLGFFAVEYPGYGLGRDYSPSEEALYADAEAALWHLNNGLGVASAQVVLEGQSLGSGVAVEMARRGHGARLVLISPFTSVPAMAKEALPILPMGWLIQDRYDNLAKAPEIAVPVLVVHGSDDEVVPFAMGERLAATFPSASFFTVQGGHHNDLFVRDGRLIVDRIAAFARGEYVGR